MLAITIQFLTGRYVATGTEDRDREEWPPHPARFYSALVATWADADVPDPAERAVLEWLETLPPPQIDASGAYARTPVTHFCPINDTSVLGASLQQRRHHKLVEHMERFDAALEAAQGDLDAPKVVRALARIDKERDVARQVGAVGSTSVKAALSVLPEGRPRHPRTFPSVTPERDTVTFLWPDAEPDGAQRQTLDGLLARVVRLGHSSSFVLCRVTQHPPAQPRFVPADQGALRLRNVGRGQLAALERAYERHQASRPRSLPHRLARYADREKTPERPAPPVTSRLSGDLFVLQRKEGARLSITAVLGATRALRGALMRHADDPVCEELSGHVPGPAGSRTRPSSRPHAAFLALPFVGSKHATGLVVGFGVLLPTEVDPVARRAILAAIGRWTRGSEGGVLKLGRDGKVHVEYQPGRVELASLRRNTWARPSRAWSTVTPIALDRHPGDLWGRRPAKVRDAYARAATTIARACRNVGLPEPDVEVTLQPPMAGTRPARMFPPLWQGEGSRRVRRALVHAHLTFAEPVRGPLVIGAGRYYGLGLLRPMDPYEQAEE